MTVGQTRRSGRPRPAEPRSTTGAQLILGTLLVVGLISVLLVHAYVSYEFVPDNRHTPGATDAVPSAVTSGGPLVNAGGDRITTRSVPPRMINLTFDDGPDPRWTPQIAAVLRRHRVRATFFVVGSQVAKHPELVRRLVADGHEVGVHSFTHPELSKLPRWRRQWEADQTQLAIAGAAGVTTSLIRFPYSSSADAIDNRYWQVYDEAGDAGYLNVLTTVDSRDWARPGIDVIIRNATPRPNAGAVVLMHDAGGDRSQTVAALDRYLPQMKRRGFRFGTVSEALGPVPQASSVTNAEAPTNLVWRGRALVWTVRIAERSLLTAGAALLVVGLLTIARTVLLYVSATVHIRRRRRRSGPAVHAPVSVIVPAYNERAGIAAAVGSLAGGTHPGIEVIVVDDGSTDGTAQVVRGLDLPNVRLISVPNGGKAAALNIGIAAASHDLIVMVDGDTVFEPDSLHRLVQPFADPDVGAVAGNVKVGNRRSLVARWQHIEYVIGFNLDRRMYEVLRCMPTVPGAIGAYRRTALAEVGGMSDDTLAEDTDLTIALNRAGWRVVYEESARAWTEAPATLRQLWTQRYRWSYGTMQALWKHRGAVTDRGTSGSFGRIGIPLLVLFQVVLPLLAPLIDILALYGWFFYDRRYSATAWLGMLAMQVLTAVVAFRLDREKLRAVWALPLQQIVYRQLMYLIIIRSIATALTGVRLRWQKLRRTGQVSVVAGTPGPRARGAVEAVPR